MGFFSTPSSGLPLASFTHSELTTTPLKNAIDDVKSAHESAWAFVQNRYEALKVIIENAEISFETINRHEECLVEKHNDMNDDIADEERAKVAIAEELLEYGSTMDDAKVARKHSEMQQHERNKAEIRKKQERLEACQRDLHEKRAEIERNCIEAVKIRDTLDKAWQRLDRCYGRVGEGLSKGAKCLARACELGDAAARALALAAEGKNGTGSWYDERVTVTALQPLRAAAAGLREQASTLKREADELLDDHRRAEAYLQDPILEEAAPVINTLHTRFCALAASLERRAEALEAAADMLGRYARVPRGLL